MWEKYKEKKISQYKDALSQNKVDPDIRELLDLINSFKEYATLSSCSGRICVINIPKLWDKVGAEFLGKWHREVSVEEVKAAAEYCKDVGWLILDPPIIHVACADLNAAKKLLNIANNSGFRRSGLISVKNLVVEIASLDRMELPISIKCKLIIPESYLKLVTDFANKKLNRAKEKLRRFKSFLEVELQ